MNWLDKLYGLWKAEPAVIRGFIAGVLGIAALWVDLEDVNALVDNIMNTLGFAILLFGGAWTRKAVSPVKE